MNSISEVEMCRFFGWLPRARHLDVTWSVCKAVNTWIAEQLTFFQPDSSREPDLEKLAEEDYEETKGKKISGRAALDILRKEQKNAFETNAKILGRRGLHVRTRMLLEGYKPTHRAYKDDLEFQKTQEGCIAREVAAASGDWSGEVLEIAETTTDEDILAKFEITPSTKIPQSMAGMNVDAMAMNEQKRARAYIRLVVNLLSSRSWTEAHSTSTLPDMMAIGLNTFDGKARSGMNVVRTVWMAIERAELKSQEVFMNMVLLFSKAFAFCKPNFDFCLSWCVRVGVG